MEQKVRLILNLRQRILLFACVAVLGYLITSVISYLLLVKIGSSTTAMMRIAIVMQDVFALIVPALVTALLITRTPADFLSIRTRLNLKVAAMALLTLIVMTPAMNAVIQWNESLHLPAALASLEQAMAEMERNASASIAMLQGENTPINLIINILIIGIAAGFSEELFFRGTLQRMLSTGGINKNAAIWIAAFVFSVLHMQFFGAVPRMLLGAYFGYLLAWSGCLWLPVIAHAFNNIMYVVAQYAAHANGLDDSSLDTFGTGDTLYLLPVSIVCTVICLIYLKKMLNQNSCDGK
jgi:hypothetical protein